MGQRRRRRQQQQRRRHGGGGGSGRDLGRAALAARPFVHAVLRAPVRAVSSSAGRALEAGPSSLPVLWAAKAASRPPAVPAGCAAAASPH
jgi:hypothetical protein